MWKNTATIHSVLKKQNYKTKFSISSILKKIERDNFGKKNMEKKNLVRNTIAIHSVL
jgi:hypothetical protein